MEYSIRRVQNSPRKAHQKFGCILEHFGGETYLSNTDHHVADQGFECCDGTSLFVSTVPHLDSDVETVLVLSDDLHDSDVDFVVGQVFGDCASWSGNGDLSGLDDNGDYK